MSDPSLLIALRGTYLNVYFLGQSIFKVRPSRNGLKATTHKKYLVDPALAGQVALNAGKFDVEKFADDVLVRSYDGIETLKKLKAAARLYSGAEKKGVHTIATNNNTVIDLEIAFSGTYSLSDRQFKRKNPRIDLVAIEPTSKAVELCFWEAKHFSNPELRSIDPRNAPVLSQVALYKKCLKDNEADIERSYARMAKTLALLGSIRGASNPTQVALEDIGAGRRPLILGEEPKVGVLVYGFDRAQSEHGDWLKYADGLTESLPPGMFQAKGDPGNISLPKIS